jgi:hypothetical protein
LFYVLHRPPSHPSIHPTFIHSVLDNESFTLPAAQCTNIHIFLKNSLITLTQNKFVNYMIFHLHIFHLFSYDKGNFLWMKWVIQLSFGYSPHGIHSIPSTLFNLRYWNVVYFVSLHVAHVLFIFPFSFSKIHRGDIKYKFFFIFYLWVRMCMRRILFLRVVNTEKNSRSKYELLILWNDRMCEHECV